MKKALFFWQSIGFATVCLLGTLLHFAYDWCGQSPLLAPFSGINESTWEHMKLLFFPLLLFTTVQSCFFEKEYDNFWCIKAIGTLFGLWLIPSLFYTYNGAIGPSPDWLNISIFYFSAALVFLLEIALFLKFTNPCRLEWIALTLLCILAILFVLFTYYPPNLPLFQDPTK